MELVIGVRLFDRVQVFALDVLDERNLQGVAVGERLFDDDRDHSKAGLLRGAEAALAGDEAVFVVAGTGDDEGLDDAVLANAAGEVLDRGVVEGPPRLVGVRRDLFDGNVRQSRRHLWSGGRFGRRLAGDEGAEAATEGFFLDAHARTLSDLWMNSLARLTYASLPRERMS